MSVYAISRERIFFKGQFSYRALLNEYDLLNLKHRCRVLYSADNPEETDEWIVYNATDPVFNKNLQTIVSVAMQTIENHTFFYPVRLTPTTMHLEDPCDCRTKAKEKAKEIANEHRSWRYVRASEDLVTPITIKAFKPINSAPIIAKAIEKLEAMRYCKKC